jgi:hypothetical protein
MVKTAFFCDVAPYWYHSAQLYSLTVQKKAIFLVSTENFNLKNFMNSMWIELLYFTLMM